MSKFDAHLSNLTRAEIITRLEGPRGLLALTSRELFYLDETTQQSARLASIKRIGVNKQTGNVDVVGEQGTMMAIAPVAFQKDDLKLFLESLKGHVLKAKAEPTQRVERHGTVDRPPATPATPSFPKFEKMVAAPSVPSAPPPNPTPQKMPPLAETVPAPSSKQISIAEPPKTLSDEPADSIWAYDGSPKPTTASTVAKSIPTPIPSAPASQGEITVPPVGYAAPVPRNLVSTQRIISTLLKVSALITVGVMVGYLVVSMGTTGDIWVPLGVISIGLSLSLIQWRLSEPY